MYHPRNSPGNDGQGTAGYIDAVILRNKDANTDWVSGAADGTMEERIYYCQNWRADVVQLISSGGQQIEGGRYAEYGVPLHIYAGDVNADGDVDGGNATQVDDWKRASTYDVRGDLTSGNLDGDVDTTDYNTCVANAGLGLDWGVLSIDPAWATFGGGVLHRRSDPGTTGVGDSCSCSSLL